MSVGDLTRRHAPVAPSTDAAGDTNQVARLAAIVDCSDDAIISKSLDGIIQSWNAGATRIFGYEPDEAIGKSITIIVPDELQEEARQILAKLRRGERIDHYETTRVAKGGRRIQVSLTISPIRNTAGTVVGASKIARDIDDQKRVERVDAFLAAIVQFSDDAIVSKTLDGIIQSWNVGATRIFGYTEVEVIGKPITMIIPPELHEEERQILKRIRRGERVEHFDTTRVTKDGRHIPVSLTVSPIRNSAGVVIGASKIGRDISERRRIEDTLRESERQLAAEAKALARLSAASTRLWRSHNLAQGLDEILLTVIELVGADKGNVQLLNAKGDTLSIVAHVGFEQDFLDFFREVTTADESACARTLRLHERTIIEDVNKDPEYAPYLEMARAANYRAVVSTPLIGVDGMPIGAISTHFREARRPTEQELRRLDLYCRQAADFIQRFRLEQTLRQSEEALREADRRKDEFLALLAHELRNPLAPIRYALAASRKPGRTADQRRRAEEIIERQVAHMSRLLDDLLDISRITRGTLDLKLNRTELTTVIGAAIEAARPILDSKQHNLSLDLPSVAVRLEADSVRLAQVFSNLLINAAKYTDPGGQIQLSAVQEQGDIVISVRDNGIGIAPDMMPRMFTLFAQAHTALGRSEGGLGVGLALVRGLVELHGGLIDVRSAGPGQGSEFIVRLPLNLPETEFTDPEAAGIGAEGGQPLKVLVVDDNIDAADSCCTLLELSGHQVATAYAGAQALELAETFRPDVVLLDIGLPDVNGYEIARTIRSAHWGHDVALVAVTGWGQDEDRRRAFEAGFDHHLTKPLAADTMEALLSSLGAPAPAGDRPGV